VLLDLAEALGCTADELARRITERELGEWMVRGKPLWPRRLEIMLAQVAAVAAQTAGNKVSLADFDLFATRTDDGPGETLPTAESGAQALSALAGGGVGVRVLGSKRRQQDKEATTHGDETR
jgi:hypothetical protein